MALVGLHWKSYHLIELLMIASLTCAISLDLRFLRRIIHSWQLVVLGDLWMVDPSIDNNSLIKTALRFMPYDMIIGVKCVFSTAGLMKD